jgi:hypothetical protein
MRNTGRICKRFLVMLVVTLGAMIIQPAYSHGQASAIQPEADQLLRKMSDYLGGLSRFRVQTENSLEVILRSGQKIQYDSPAECLMQRPNKLFAERKGGIVNQEFYYDGKTLTLYNPDQKYYATVAAPPTIDQALDFARVSLDLYAPGSDLLYKDTYKVLMEDAVSGFYVGMSVVGGIKCHHLAFTGNNVDWQIWIEDGDKPLPKKFTITTKWMTGAPEFTLSVKKWDLSPEFPEDAFTFVAPKDAQRINFVRLIQGGASGN